MKNIFFIIIFIATANITFGQQANVDQVKVGDILIIGEPSGDAYQHIKIPKKNFIIKRGGIPNLKALSGVKVVVTDLQTKNDKPIITLARKDGGRFFGSHKTLKAYLSESVDAGELHL